MDTTSPAAPAATTDMMFPTLILGCGNMLFSDDGAGLRLLNQLAVQTDPAHARFVNGGNVNFDVFSHVESATSMLVVGAADLREAPGTVAIFEGADMDAFLSGFRRRTAHELGLANLMDLARLLRRLPSRRALLAIQPGRIDRSNALSAPVDAALPLALKRAEELLRRWRGA
jgi:hydrogenase maturation protease